MASRVELLEITAAARRYNAWLFDRARPYLRRRVLDVGAGIGTFTDLLAAAGHEVVALEPDPRFAERLRERFAGRADVTVVEAGVEDMGLADSFDSILCFNVLEHVADDEGALRVLRDRLAPGGRLLLLVPAHPLLLAETDRALGHHRRYTRTGLRAALGRAGYEVERLRHVNPVGALGWLLWFRLRRPRDRWPAGAYRVYDRLVPLLRALDRLPLPAGLSLWAIARHPPRSSAGAGRAPARGPRA
jgi:SAM-dependent methyltransferase